MTLQEWCKANGIIPCYSSCVSIIYEGNDWQLFHLTDYAVSTRSGPVVWLVPRKGSK